MKNWMFIIAAFCYLALLWACAAFVEGEPAPARSEGPQFDHAGHIDRGVECSYCHGEEGDQWMAMPSLESCMECHSEIDEEAPPEKRAAAFYDESGAGKWLHVSRQDDEVIFDHAAHVASEEDCNACHAAVAVSTALPSDARMSMAQCMDCHARTAPASNDCASCHREIRVDKAPASHRLGWTKEHGRVVRAGGFDPLPPDCAMCHTKSICDECHRSEMPRSHNNLWRHHGHGTMASMDRDSCAMCHTTDSCFECHQRSAPRNHRGTWGAPFSRHCNSCHLPLDTGFQQEGCAVCHRSTVSHDTAPPRPPNPIHMTNDPAACRACHTPPEHPDNGQSCLLCHQ